MLSRLNNKEMVLIISDDEFLNKTKEECLDLFKKLVEENKQLREEINNISVINIYLMNENIKLNNKVDELYKNFNNQSELKEQIKNLEKENNNFKVIIGEQNNKIKKQDIIIAEQSIEIKNLKKDISEVLKRDNPSKRLREAKPLCPITIREAMSTLEKHIMIEIAGSKRQAFKYHGINELSKDNKYEIQINEYFKNNSITQKHIDLILYFKHDGNQSAHINRPLYTKDEWNQLLIDGLEDKTLEDIDIISKLINLMEKYFPITNPWILNKP